MRLFFLLGGLGLMATAVPAAEKWLWLKSPNFEMLSNADERSARSHLEELEQFRSVFLQFTGVIPEVPLRTTVVLFATEDEFKRHAPPQPGGREGRIGGFFSGNQVNGFMALALGRYREETKRIIYHEYVHSLFHEIEWQPPTWFNEGAAEVFSTFQVRKGVASLGRAQDWHAALLRQQSLMPLPHLFSIDRRSPEYNEGTLRGLFYAQSWALTHFLICNRDPAWRDRLGNFLGLVSTGRKPGVKEFESAMGISSPQIQKLLEDHVYGGGYVIYKATVEDAGWGQKITSRPAAEAEKECVLAVLRVFTQNSPIAAAELMKLQERNPRLALPHEARAVLAFRRDDPQRAEEELLRAVELDTENIRVYWHLARDLVRRWLTTDISPYKRIAAPNTERLRALLHRVLRDSPQAMEAWEALARTEAFAIEPDRVTVDKLEAQARLKPDEPNSVQMLLLVGFVRKRLGDEAAAREIAQAIAESPTAAKSTKHLNRILLGEFLATPAGGG